MPTSRPSNEALLKAVVDCGRDFYERGWMSGTAGNLSVKLQQDPLEIAITPSGAFKGGMSTKDLILLSDKKKDAAKGPVKKGETPSTPSAETVIHQVIHQTLPGCNAVFHVHPMYSALISGMYGNPKQRQMLEFEWFEMMKGVGVVEGEIAQIPIFPNWQDVSLVAQDIKQYLTQTPKPLPAVLIHNHGLTGWGRTPEQARNHLEILEYVCQYLYLKKLQAK